jgi:hypothetical protein
MESSCFCLFCSNPRGWNLRVLESEKEGTSVSTEVTLPMVTGGDVGISASNGDLPHSYSTAARQCLWRPSEQLSELGCHHQATERDIRLLTEQLMGL